MNITKIAPAHVDERGSISDILYKEPIEHVTIIHSKKGAKRGNHFHKESTQWIYVLNGVMEYWHSDVNRKNIQMVLMNEGDLVHTPPSEIHALYMVTPVSFLAISHGLRGGEDYESDTYRVDNIIGSSEHHE